MTREGPDAGERWRRVATLIERLAAAQSLEAIADLLRAGGRAAIGADGIGLIMRHDEELRHVAEEAIAPLWEGRSVAIDDGLPGLALTSGTTISTDDVRDDPRVALGLYDETFVRSLVLAPIGDRRGVIGAYWAREGAPDPQAVAMVEALARTVGTALAAIDRLAVHRTGEERLQAALAAGRMGSWEIDVATRTLTCTDDCRAHFGRFGDARFVYDDLIGAVHRDDRKRMFAAVERSVETGEDYDIEYRCVWPDGSEHLLHVRGVLGFGADGAVDRMTGVTADITERRRVEAALRQSQADLIEQTERFRIAQQAGEVGAFEWYPETGAMVVSDEYRKLWGFGPDQIVDARTLVDRLHPDDRLSSGPARIDTHDNPLEYAEYRIRRADTGVERWIGRRGEIMVTADGRQRFVGVAFDITERKRAEASLRESEARFRLIADSAPVPMWVTVAGGGARAFANRAYCDFLGLEFEAALTFDWRSRIHDDDVARIYRESVAGEASGRAFSLEGRYLRSDGEWRWLRSESQPRWGPDGEHDGFIGIAYDITAAKQGEEELRRSNDRLEERVESALAGKAQAEAGLRQAQKMEAVGRLTGGIAHDFNNLLTPVMGGLEMIADRVADPRLKRIATNALTAAQRGAKLTGQLLAFSRIQRLSIAPVDVNRVVADMLELVRGTAGPLIAVRTDLEADLPLAMGDANQLENAILNLAINARDAMPDGGTLTIASKAAMLSSGSDHAAGDYVALSIVDSGEGMPGDVLARATEPFFTTKTVGQGTGLGLAQVDGIARQSGGTMTIESVVGEGTTVCILLPRAAADAGVKPERTAPDMSPAAPRGDARILVIDDDVDVRNFLAETVSSLGYTVAAAESGEAGLERLCADAPDLVLVDYAMTGMTGAEFAAAARQVQPALPIMVVSGHADSDALQTALGERMRVLKKPFAIGDLATAIADALEG